MKKQKTVRVEEIRSRVNERLSMTADGMTEYRMHLSGFLEGLLMDTGNYSGFGYITPEMRAVTARPLNSVGMVKNGEEWEIIDKSRRFYY